MLTKGAIYWAAALGMGVAAGAGTAIWRYNSPAYSGAAPAQLLGSSAAASNSPPQPAAAASQAIALMNPAQPAATAAPSQKLTSRRRSRCARNSTSSAWSRPERLSSPAMPLPRRRWRSPITGKRSPRLTPTTLVNLLSSPPNFAPGGHSLGLTASAEGGKPVASADPVAIDVPLPASAAKVALASKPSVAAPRPANAPARAAAAPSAKASEQTAAATLPAKAVEPAPPAESKAAVAASPQRPRVSVFGVTIEDAGRFVATGAAPAGALLRLYLNGSFLANVTAGADGRWSLTVQRGMKGGAYALRADEVDRAKDSVISRAEVPFNYPERVAELAGAVKPPAVVSDLAPKLSPVVPAAEPSKAAITAPADVKSGAAPPAAASATPTSPAPATASAAPPAVAAAAKASPVVASNEAPAGAANAIVRDIDTAKVVRGDSLWRISSTHYGNGVRYRQIFAANAAQIRDPRLIYPGQIFVLPQPTPF